MATRNSKSKSKSTKSNSLKSKRAARTRNIHAALGLGVIGLVGYAIGQGIEKAVAYA